MSASRSSSVLGALLAISLSACSGERSPGHIEETPVLDPTTACAEVRPLPVAMAVLDYITTAEPRPLRFLNAVTTDSALPAAAEVVVQDKGPTFYWLPQGNSQQQIREKLERAGQWPSMLVVVRENADNGDGTHTVRVGGTYIGKPLEGVVSPEKRYTLRCIVADSTASWTMDPGVAAP